LGDFASQKLIYVSVYDDDDDQHVYQI